MLNGKEMMSKGIITNVHSENIQQHGIDLNVIQIQRMTGTGAILKSKTILPKYEDVETALSPSSVNGSGAFWTLTPGPYNVMFEQGCNIPADAMLLIAQRSSLLRNGVILHSSVFDAGFKTDNIGTVIVVTRPVIIEYGARIAQIFNHECTLVENLYNGQWQNDKQRK